MTSTNPGAGTSNVTTDAVHVLYIDHEKHPAPLSICFHATASRRLASLADRHPPTMTAEVDSAYCPQCLSFYDVAAAATMGYCPKASCKRCPTCQSIAAVSVDDGKCVYKCGSCDWTSQRCDLSVPCEINQDDVTSNANLEAVEKASEELASQLKSRTEQENAKCQDHYRTILQSLQGMAKENVKRQRSTTPIFSSAAATMPKRSLDGGPQSWSVQTLEESMVERVKLTQASLEETTGGQPVQIVSLEAEQSLHDSLKGLSPETLLLQPPSLAISGLAAMNPRLLPLGVPLRARKSRRDRAELAEGRPGILLKPKLNPLEGDSSLRTGHGNWWKKDSSAMEVLPRVRVASHLSDGTKHAFLLKVSNPTLGSINLRLAGSSYKGEAVWDDPNATNSLLEDVLVDPLTQESINAALHPELSSDLAPTDVCQLESAEDTFIELGKSSSDMPDDIKNWKADEVLANTAGDMATILRMVGQHKSMSWFEVVLAEPEVTASLSGSTTINSKFGHVAIPLSLQVQVGEGSWDSSLIQPRFTEDGGKDFVPFEFLLAWSKGVPDQ
mmetsp:Transcript_110/g.171  ORF Transcript_110/g.171 Transcript_110/m.171 type:complete len:557 (-) Transcript_110:56-1726(-)